MQNQRLSEQIATVTLEEIRKRGRPRIRWREEFYENLNRDQAGIGQRPYCQPVLEKKKRNVFVTFLRIFQAEPDFRLTLRI